MSHLESPDQRPARSDAAPASPGVPPSQPVRYETAKGCLSFVVVGLVLAALVCAVVVIFGEPPTV